MRRPGAASEAIIGIRTRIRPFRPAPRGLILCPAERQPKVRRFFAYLADGAAEGPCRAGAVLGQAFGRRRKTKPRLATPVPSKPSNYRFATSSSPHPQPRSHRPTCAILGRRTNEILTVVDIVADLPVPGTQVHLRQLARRSRRLCVGERSI